MRGVKTTTTIDRRDFGLTWNAGVKKAGNSLIGDEVEISIRLVLL